MSFLTATERRTLALICQTLLPSLEPEADDHPDLFRCSASDLDLATHLEAALELAATEQMQRQLRLFLRSIESGLFNRLSCGQTDSFSRLSPQERETLLRAWATSDLPMARKTFQSLKQLAMFLFYSLMPDGQPNPTWTAFHYAPPTPQTDSTERAIRPLHINTAATLHADALVIGSGAGGGVVAGELAAAGFDVIVAEKGGYHAEADFNGRELDSTERMFEKRGSVMTADLAMLILAGSTLGGGTTINWAASFRPPDSLLHEWERDYGFTGAAGAEFARSVEAVMQRLNVCETHSEANPQNCALQQGCEALGYKMAVIPRNVKNCAECGFCNFGCADGAKQSTLKTYLQDAHERGARILVNAHVERILIEQGQAVGALLTVHDENGQAHRVTIRAKLVVAAAGSIHTPALLLRSGLTNAHIGANLHLHPTTSIYGLFDHPIRGWQGAPMTRVSSEFADLDGRGYGVRLETAPVHPGIAALALAWDGGRQHRQIMNQLEHLANIIIITRDRDGGRVTLDKAGNPVIHYRLSQRDAAHLLKGTVEALRVHHAANAYQISSPHTSPLVYRRDANGGRSIDNYLAEVAARGYRRHSFVLFSAHQMSSCRIGGNSATGALMPTGETYEVRKLYVADGSTLPTASGVNPMITIMSTAHYIAQQIKAAHRA